MKRRANLKQQVMGDEVMVMDEAADKVHVLNATSAFIWNALDETTDVAEIERRVRAHFKASQEYDVAGLVGRAILQFKNANLIVEG